MLLEKIRIPGLYETQNGRQGVKLRVFILKVSRGQEFISGHIRGHHRIVWWL